MKFLYWLGILSVFVISCTTKVVYKHTVKIENGFWTYENPAQFSFSVQDTSILYRLALNIEHGDDYPYENLYVKIHTEYPDQSTKADVVSLELADHSGLWNGACRRNTCRVNIPLQEKTYFSDPGDYTLQLEQYMREDSIPGIRSLELILVKTDSYY